MAVRGMRCHALVMKWRLWCKEWVMVYPDAINHWLVFRL